MFDECEMFGECEWAMLEGCGCGECGWARFMWVTFGECPGCPSGAWLGWGEWVCNACGCGCTRVGAGEPCTDPDWTIRGGGIEA